MDPNQEKAAYAQPAAYVAPQAYGPFAGQGLTSSAVHLVGSTDPLNDPRIKYSETLCLARAVSWFPLADMVMWIFLLRPQSAWLFGLFMIKIF